MRKNAKLPKVLGKKIQKLRKQMGVSQDKFAVLMNISRVYVGFIEQGRYSPSLKLLMKMARKFGVKVEELFKR